MGSWAGLLARGALVTVGVGAAGFALSVLIGVFGSWARLSNSRSARLIATAYVTVVRGVPNLITIFIVYYGTSALLTDINKGFGGHGFKGLPLFVAGFLALGVTAGALTTEVFRGAARAVGVGQMEAARAYGMTQGVAFRRVLAPLALRHALPALGNVWQGLLKESALLSVIGLAELLDTAQLASNSTNRPFVYYAVAVVGYLLITMVSGLVWHVAERRFGARGESAYV
jgi:octopine/nopaline transport system permease protein